MSSARLDALDALPLDPVSAAHRRAAACLLRHRDGFGGWEGEVVWCPVITAQAAIVFHVMRHPVEAAWRRLVLKQFAATQHETGGWGLHPASLPYRFVTTPVYVAARLLGEPAASPSLLRARQWLDAAPGDVYGLPSWGKFWLFVLGLTEREGLHPCPPELFLLPDWVPFAPNRLYCHTRYIYLGMATVLAGPKGDAGPLGPALRAELGLDGRSSAAHRHDLVDTDAYVRPSRLLRVAYDAVRAAGAVWRRLPGAAALRRRAVARCLRRIAAEQRTTRYQGLSPVSGLLNTLALHRAGMPEAAESAAALDAWAWSDEGAGLRYAGARSTTWDTALAMQALLAPARSPVGIAGPLRRAHHRLASMQQQAELPPGADEGRQSVLGGWCFSDGTHRWPVSDCTAEALSAILLCEASPGLIPPAERLPRARVRQALVFLLDRQNEDGCVSAWKRGSDSILLKFARWIAESARESAPWREGSTRRL